MAHVDGSGTAGTLKIEILGLAGSFAAGLIHCCTAFEPDISVSRPRTLTPFGVQH